MKKESMTNPATVTNQPDTKKKLFIVWLILLTAWIAMTIIPLVSSEKTGRLFADYDDRRVYFQRGKWFTESKPLISEYPQIPTFLFGINHLVSMGFADPDRQFGAYVAIFSLEMILVLYLVFKILFQLLPSHLNKYAFLLLLPPTLYFTYNRFDILPVYFCVLAFSAATKKQWTMASIILALATFTKWYPILLFPGFFIYAAMLERKIQWKMVWAFAIISITILLLSYLQGGLITILAPFKVHLARGMEFTSLPVIINNSFHNFFNVDVNLSYFFLLFFIIQVSGPLLVFFIKIDSLKALTDYCIIVIGIFILFSRIWSPQWFLWLLPFLILSTKNIQTAALVVAYNFTSYVGFPIMFDRYGGDSYQLQLMSLLIYIILIAFILRAIKNIKFTNIYVSLKTWNIPLKNFED